MWALLVTMDSRRKYVSQLSNIFWSRFYCKTQCPISQAVRDSSAGSMCRRLGQGRRSLLGSDESVLDPEGCSISSASMGTLRAWQSTSVQSVFKCHNCTGFSSPKLPFRFWGQRSSEGYDWFSTCPHLRLHRWLEVSHYLNRQPTTMTHLSGLGKIFS